MLETSAVRKLHDTPVEKVVATAFSVVIGLTNDRQITFQSGYEGDEADAVVFARLQRTMGFADKLKAVYEIPGLEEDLDRHDKAIARFQQDRDAIEDRHRNEQAFRQVQIDTKTTDAQDNWTKSGRRGSFSLQGATAAAVANLKSAIAAAENEIKVGRENFKTTMERHQEERALCAAKLAKAKALAEG